MAGRIDLLSFARLGSAFRSQLAACPPCDFDIVNANMNRRGADLCYIWTACHNPARPVGAVASCHAASATREFRIQEIAKSAGQWPVAKAHLAPGETWRR